MPPPTTSLSVQAAYLAGLAVYELKIFRDFIPILIGKKGATIQRLTKESGSGVRIKLDRETNTVRIVGTKESADKVKRERVVVCRKHQNLFLTHSS